MSTYLPANFPRSSYILASHRIPHQAKTQVQTRSNERVTSIRKNHLFLYARIQSSPDSGTKRAREKRSMTDEW